ncbi:hypothetical protein [uncultured Brevundimonas sp.]|uniref:hypothetical protein n=1 Tax=uncultured Brevundimonas sp. TaxID=213418 RepID=UPI0030ECB184|tara:strand:+ start:65765 stop:66364 length:600 start_codon:yes stop_codon:yes gene_type:complete
MLDIQADAAPDRRPAIVICAYDAAETGWDPVEDLSGIAWNPPGARTVPVAADDPDTLATTLQDQLEQHGCRALLLVGRTSNGESFHVQMRAENRVLDGTRRLDDTGPGVARATAPVAEIVQALNDAGLAAAASSESEADAGSYLLFRILSGLPDGIDSPAIGLLRAPAAASDAAVQRAVKAAAEAIASHLSPLPRSHSV